MDAEILDGDVARPAAIRLQRRLQIREQLRIAGAKLEHDAARLLFAQPLELTRLVRAQHPRIRELVEAYLAFDEQQRVLHEQLAELLVLLVEETHLDAAG